MRIGQRAGAADVNLVFDWSAWVMACGMLALMFAANEVGFRLGGPDDPEDETPDGSAFKGSVLGLVALLLGFSFSMTVQRYDQRRAIVNDEANALGTLHLRAGLIPDPQRQALRAALRIYVAARLERFERWYDAGVAERTRAEMSRQLDAVWAAVESAANAAPDATRNALLVPAANAVIDLDGTRRWATTNSIPWPVLLLLGAATLISSLLIGHSCGAGGRRQIGLWAALNVLMALVLFVILDFDHPRRGFVQVDHRPLLELQASFGPAAP